MRTGIAVLALALALGCAQLPGPQGGTGTVSGHVLATPCAPVEIAGSPCPGRPVADLAISFAPAGAGGATAEATTDGSGFYHVQLAAGTWTVSFKSFGRKLSGPSTVTVEVGGRITADYVVDSGIR